MSVPPANRPRVFRVHEVHAELARLLRDRNHMGLRNLLGDSVLEPRSPFQSARRKLKRWIVFAGAMALLGLLIVAFFHFG